jgi:polyisoprenyl-phosphate glycosyltransferase
MALLAKRDTECVPAMTLSDAQTSRLRVFPASIDVVVPSYNEEKTLPISTPSIIEFLHKVVAANNTNCQLRVILVDDGSRDMTWEVICAETRRHPEVTGLKLARNYGHQSALLAGLTQSDADVAISIDADLQDDLGAMAQMIERYREGAEIVFGVRENRSSDTLFKRATAAAFYRLMAALGVQLVHNHADYRLMSRKALLALREHDEANLFLRGLVSTMGFATQIVPYARTPRIAGETSYTVSKMMSLALTGLLAFSTAPLRLIAVVGLVSSLVSLGVALWVTSLAIFRSAYIVPGWASILLPTSLFASLQLLTAGIIGEYVGRIYLEVKRRPRFFVDRIVTGSEQVKDAAVQWSQLRAQLNRISPVAEAQRSR